MKPTAIFFLFLLVCLAAGALLTYPVVQTTLVDAPPHRIATRLTQLFILAGFWPFVRVLGLNNRLAFGVGAGRAELGRSLVLGWLMGVGILAALSFSLYGLGVRVPAPPVSGLPCKLIEVGLQALAAGMLIAMVEEVFFRGTLFSAVRRQGSAAHAMLWSSFLYALLHFLKPHALGPVYAVDWTLSWTLFAGTFTDFPGREELDSMLALFLAGLLLAAVRERTGHIGYCIGIHAGWVFVIKLTRFLTDGNPTSPYAFLVGDYDGLTGYLAALWLGLLLFLWWGINRARARQAEIPTEPR